MQINILPAPTPAFEALVDTHTTFCDGTAPAESCHRLPVSRLFTPDITVWVVQEGETAIGMGALKQLSEDDGEIKSMHTRASARGQGIAKAMLGTIIAAAKAKGLKTLWLETGVHPDFAAARALYKAHGFTECAPFGDYVLDPHSVFMTKALEAAQ
ncbi:GNAT family N-acetyltransferase [Tropicibacter naphthalenivorans]|uniref:Putative N-acetyltransferase YsnE n=1 Tax=Tropicibacter naphthalenivorans TaxID=441103 RepID=A0A0N7LYM9_9RHOB|nr:GNAT family N-acetyltransferase [Tropicibacter naphthalenivorans]CUH75313.1 putative N-acetyltransferase YsnE [Tropicibacter naphthalenivorans]SMC45113.1 putative acetyltransferase [Tropicibacter naphthalenivorans]